MGTPTKVQVPLPPSPAGFSAAQIASWSLGGGGLGTTLLRLTLDLLSFDTVWDMAGTLAPIGTLTHTVQLSGTDGLKLNGSGTLILGAANNFSGDVVLTQGTLQLGLTGAPPAGPPVHLGTGTILNHAWFAATPGKHEGSGNVALGAANLTIAQSSNSTFAGAISGSGGLAKSGGGVLTLTGTHTFTGATAITGGQLRLNGSAAGSAFTVSGGILSGSATVGALTVASGGTISPGSSPGSVNAADTTWAGDGNFTFEINQATGGIAGTNWDLLAITGSLTITATSDTRFTVGLNTLDFSNAAGVPVNFSAGSNYTFAFVTTTTGIICFDPGRFTLTTTGVDLSLTGTWSIGQSGSNLNLLYTGNAIPEPSTSAAILGACALALAVERRNARLQPPEFGET